MFLLGNHVKCLFQFKLSIKLHMGLFRCMFKLQTLKQQNIIDNYFYGF